MRVVYLLALLAVCIMGQTERKRGLGGYLGDAAQCGDAAALNLQDSWWYTWNTHTCKVNGQADYCVKHNKAQAAEYVPMIHTKGGAGPVLKNENEWKYWKPLNARYLLGYNEPDGNVNPVTPEEAVADWPSVQKVANLFDPPLIIVSPAPTSNNFTEDGISGWLDSFFELCGKAKNGCDPDLIQHIAFHDYVGNLDKLEKRIAGMYTHYGNRPIWLTEYAIINWKPTPTKEEENEYLMQTLPMLDANPAIYRYAWFSSRCVPASPNPFYGDPSLLPYNNTSLTPTSTGVIYSSPENSGL